MTADMFNALLAQVPDIVSAMVEWNGDTRPKYSLVVRKYSPNGTMLSQDCNLIDEEAFLYHLNRAKKQNDCSFDLVSDEKVVVRRSLRNGDYFLAEYKPARGTH